MMYSAKCRIYVLILSMTFALILFKFNALAFMPDVFDPKNNLANLGDINLGAVMSIHERYNREKICGTGIPSRDVLEHADAFVYAVKMVNEDESILPNLTLGYVVLDDCYSNKMTLARSLQFMPNRIRGSKNEGNNGSGTLVRKESCHVVSAKERFYYDVVGVIGALTSERTKILANVMTLFQIPHISYSSTADILSNKRQYPFFLRMIPPDRFQAETIADLLVYYNWTYVSAVYSRGVYGRGGMKLLQQALVKRDICLATVLETDASMRAADYDDLIEDLMKYPKARVVIAYLGVNFATSFALALGRNKRAANALTLVGSDAFSFVVDVIKRSNIKINVVLPYTEPTGNFDEYLRGNHVSFSGEIHNDTLQDGVNIPNVSASLVIDAVWVFAHALDHLVKTSCPKQNRECATSRVKGRDLLDAIINVKFNASSGFVRFDKNGDVIGKFQILQLWTEGGVIKSQRLGIWNRRTRYLTILRETNLTVTSHCSNKCGPDEEYFYPKGTCCWECRKCAPNQYLKSNSKNASHCSNCPEFTWPNDDRSQCVAIEPETMKIGGKISIILYSLSVLGILGTLVISMIYFVQRNEKIIRSTSRELSSMILAGIFLQFLVVISMASDPTQPTCYINHIGVNLTCTFVYAPLLMKTNRVYRIFRAGRKSTVRPSCTKPCSQVAISIAIILVQVILLTIGLIIQPTSVHMRMPVSTHPFVEVYCLVEIEAAMSATAYNIVLVAICMYFAFQTRKLPDNYNESRFIAFSIDSTFLLWVSYIPAYVSTSRSLHHVTLAGGLLILQGYVWLACLFLPKLLTLRRQKSNDENLQNFVKHNSSLRGSFKTPSTRQGDCIESPSDIPTMI